LPRQYHEALLDVSTLEPARWFVPSSSYPARAGNRVGPLIDGEPAFRRIAESVESAQQSVWVTVAFLWASFEMPDGRGSFFDVLGRAARRGLDVRVLFWRPGDELSHYRTNAFWGAPEHRAHLEAQGFRGQIRWDRAARGYCQHQKSWLVDAGHETATAFVGGINLNPHSVVAPGHRGEGHNHDVYVEIAGPSTVDVHHNFVQRWNGASERAGIDGYWGDDAGADLPFPSREPRPQGPGMVQIQRTMPAGQYGDGDPAVGGPAHDIAAGERSIFDQYRAAIRAARRSIYLENQYLEVPEMVACCREALERGIEVVLVLPGDLALTRPAAPIDVQRRAFLDARAALGGYPNFTLAGLAGRDSQGERAHVYVHSKVMLVDDEWATIGSCNLHAPSLFGNAEMNASFWDPEVVRALRCRLFEEHLGESTEHLDDVAALQRFGQVARENTRRWTGGDQGWPGLAFSLDPAAYGR
jgi:cardiolipin synthase A/B